MARLSTPAALQSAKWNSMQRIIFVVSVSLALVACSLVALAGALTPPLLPAPLQTDLVISDVTILNPGASRSVHQTIIVQQGVISEIRNARPNDPVPICANCVAMPGLIDAHVHTPPQIALGNQRLFALLYLAHGVTSVRDLGQSDDSVAHWANRLNAGAEAGPHVYRCGPVLDGRDLGWPSALSVTTPEQGRATVRRLAAAGVDCIKVYNHVDRETFAAISDAAHAAHLPLIGHVPHLVGLRGVENFEAQHLTGFPYIHRAPPWDNDIALADLAAMSDDEIDEALAITKAQHVSLTPTISTAVARLTASDPARFPPTPDARYMPVLWATTWASLVPHPVGERAIDIQLAAVPRIREIANSARRSGIDVLAGTDTLMPWAVPGESLLLEIDQLAQAFGDNEAALAAATTVNGRHIDADQIGLVAVGARADILLLGSDPVQDLSALRRWRVVLVDGHRYDRAMIDTWLSQYERHFQGSLYTNVFGALVRVISGGYASHLQTNRRATARCNAIEG